MSSKHYLLFLTLFLALSLSATGQYRKLQQPELSRFANLSPHTFLLNQAEEKLEADASPDGKYQSFVRGMNLYVVETATGKETQLTKDGGENILNGRLDWVYEEELYGRGDKRGYWWSPDSTAIAFLRTDESRVPKFAVVSNISQTDNPAGQEIEDTPYPKAGDPNPVVKLGLADLKTGAVKFVETANYKPEDFLISRVAWSPNSKRIVYQAQNREQTFLDLNSADRETGATTLIFKETSPAWVEVIDNPTFLKDNSFIWQSAARSGWKHLYHFDQNGKLIKQLTGGDWEVRDFYGADEKNGFVYFSATKDSPVALQIYRVKLDGTGLQKISTGAGSHQAAFNKDFTQFTDIYSDINSSPQIRLFNASGSPVRAPDGANLSKGFSTYKLNNPEFLEVKTRDGFRMEALMIKPPNFDPNKKYPVMQFTYAGPHAPEVQNEWLDETGVWYQMLSEKGYIIWIVDNRTASGKGVQSEYVVYKNFGESELRDLEDGITYLKTLSFVDQSRIGLHGWSFGGYMTAFALTHSKSWKIGIAGGTVADWSLYDSIYTERYMKTPQTNPDGYKKSSVTAAAANLHGKLLIIHGAIDDNVHLQNAMQLIYALQKAGKPFEFMPYPTERHGVADPQLRKHLYQTMTDYILANL